MKPTSRSRPGGTILVLVLMMMAVVAMVVVAHVFLTHSELSASAAARAGHQARAAAMSGVYRAMAVLTDTSAELSIVDNPELFQAQIVTGDDESGWRFTVFAESLTDTENVRCGLEDEAGKISINFAPDQTLAALEGMTDELVDCLRDYIDSDSETRPQGAEQEDYDRLARPYLIANGPLLTLEELLLVKGFSGSVVYGEDANRNGLLEANEDDGEGSFPPDDGDGVLDRGLRAVATAAAYEPNVDNEGKPRININTGSAASLAGPLGEAGFGQTTIDFIAAARTANTRFTDPSQLLGMTIEAPDPRNPNRRITLASGVDESNLALVMDKLTVGGINMAGQEMLVGRVNVNSASIGVLCALPGLDEDSAQGIVDHRESLDDETRRTTAWLYTENILSAEVFKGVAPLVTARSYQYRVRSLGYHTDRARFCVIEAVIDLSSGAPRITYLRELTRLGVPFDPSGIER